MKVIIVSDSHGKKEILDEIREEHNDAVAFLHCGDIELESNMIKGYQIIQGNNDLYLDYPQSLIVEVANTKIFIIHGHQFMIRSRVSLLVARAKELGCDVACFGHTHVAHSEIYDGVLCINPGSIWRSRDGREPSYAILTINGDKKDVEFVFLKK